MSQRSTDVATLDTRPFFVKALRFGLQHDILSPGRLETMLADGPKGIVQIANHFGTAHLRTDLENACERMVNLVSLYLAESTGEDLQRAAVSLRDKTFLSHSKGGSDLLRMLHVLPDSTMIGAYTVQPEDQKNFLNDASLASPMTLADYRAELVIRQGHQKKIDLAVWLARKMGVKAAHLQSAQAEWVIRSALLVLFVRGAKSVLPGRSGLAKLLQAAQKKTSKLDVARLDAFLVNEPTDFQAATRDEMANFIDTEIPKLRASDKTVDALLHDGSSSGYYINEDITEELGEYDRLVAKEWYRVTKGDGDDPAVVATILLFVATGQPASARILQREAREVIRAYRSSGFDSKAVLDFIESHAPYQMRQELKSFWVEDLMPDAETHLSDLDPDMPDTHMERALRYFQKTCNVTWKGRGRQY